MPNTRKYKQHGRGYVTSAQMFNPADLPPATILPAMTTAPTSLEIRPVLTSTFQNGGKRSTRANKQKGGFAPSIMGGFVANAQAAIVPLALYMVYHTMVPKTNAEVSPLVAGMKKTRKNRKSQKSQKHRK